MNKDILIISFCFILIGCGGIKKKTYQKDEDNNLLGVINEKSLKQYPYSEWYDENYEKYKIDSVDVDKIKIYLKDVRIKAFIATWCSDSKREVPRFYKVLRNADFNFDNLEIISLNENKKTPDDLQKGFDIVRVPTYIFYKDDKEVGRYVEYSVEYLEKDLLKILSGQPYEHN